MKALSILTLSLFFIACKKEKSEPSPEPDPDYTIQYTIETYGTALLDTIIYMDENSIQITLAGDNIPVSFSKSFKKKKGFHSYLYVKGATSGTGQLEYKHSVTSESGVSLYTKDESYSTRSGILYFKTKTEYTLQ